MKCNNLHLITLLALVCRVTYSRLSRDIHMCVHMGLQEKSFSVDYYQLIVISLPLVVVC
jgi:hypothetical protein